MNKIKERQQRVLIYVHSDCLGDALFKLPAIRDLRTLFPNHHITWLAGRGKSLYRDALHPLVADYIDEIIDCAGVGASWAELFGPAPMPGQHFNVLIDTQTSIRPMLCVRRIDHNVFVSAAARYLFSGRKPVKLSRNIVSVQKQLLQLFGLAAGKEAKAVHDLVLPQPYRQAAEKLLPAGSRYIGFAPGAGGRHKCWPLDNYLDLAKRFQQQGARPVFFLGPDELVWRERILSEVPEARLPEQEAAQISDMPGGPLLMLALAERLALGVANDSGPGHALASTRRPLVSLFGPTNPDRFAEPYAGRVILRAQMFGGKTMSGIPVDKVYQVGQELLGGGGECPRSP